MVAPGHCQVASSKVETLLEGVHYSGIVSVVDIFPIMYGLSIIMCFLYINEAVCVYKDPVYVLASLAASTDNKYYVTGIENRMGRCAFRCRDVK